MRTDAAGYSLIELLCVMCIAATLAGLAVPASQAVLHRVHRNEARLALLLIHGAQERWYAERLRYAAALQSPDDKGLTLPLHSEYGRYELQLRTQDDGQHYRAEARPVPGSSQAQDSDCAVLWIDELGRHGSQGAATVDCWR
jgi:type IV pilus assembly protein PilE